MLHPQARDCTPRVLSGAFFGMVNGEKITCSFTLQNIKFMSYLMEVGWL